MHILLNVIMHEQYFCWMFDKTENRSNFQRFTTSLHDIEINDVLFLCEYTLRIPWYVYTYVLPYVMVWIRRIIQISCEISLKKCVKYIAYHMLINVYVILFNGSGLNMHWIIIHDITKISCERINIEKTTCERNLISGAVYYIISNERQFHFSFSRIIFFFHFSSPLWRVSIPPCLIVNFVHSNTPTSLLPPSFYSATAIVICVVVIVVSSLVAAVATGIVLSIVSAVFRTLAIRRPIKICTSPVLIDLKTLMASACFIPCNGLPFTTSISSPGKKNTSYEKRFWWFFSILIEFHMVQSNIGVSLVQHIPSFNVPFSAACPCAYTVFT